MMHGGVYLCEDWATQGIIEALALKWSCEVKWRWCHIRLQHLSHVRGQPCV